MKLRKPMLIFIAMVALLLLIFWPKHVDPLKEDCECIGVPAPFVCYGIQTSCDYLKPDVTVQEERKVIETKIADVDIAIVMDSSQSMRGASLDEAKLAMVSLVDKLEGDDRAAVVKFDEEARLVQGFTTDAAELRRKISSLTAAGRTRYIPALRLAKDEFLEYGNLESRFVMLFVSDGQPDDEGRPDSILDELSEITQLGICVHTVGYGDSISEGSEAELVLKRSAELSQEYSGCGSYSYAPQGEEALDKIFSGIYENIVLGQTLTVDLISPMNTTYQSELIEVSFDTSREAECSYRLNNGNVLSITKGRFDMKAESGKNLFVLDCEGIVTAREFTVERYDLIEALKGRIAGLDIGQRYELTDRERENVLDRVLVEMNLTSTPGLKETMFSDADLTRERARVHKKVSSKDGRTSISATIDSDLELKDLDIYLDIPKCMAEKLNELVFYDENFRILADDPLIMWHFDAATERIDLSMEVLKEIEDICAQQLRIVPVAGGFGGPRRGLLFRNLLPLLLVPLIVGIVLFAKELKFSEEEIRRRPAIHRHRWLLVLIIIVLLFAYPKDIHNEMEGQVRDCSCLGFEAGNSCLGLLSECMIVDRERSSGRSPICSPANCGVVEDYLVLDEAGEPDFIDLDMTLILDRSRSMKGERMERAKLALKGLIEIMGENDRAALIRFDNNAQLVQQFTSDKEAAKRAIDGIQVGKTTKYIPALEVALENYLAVGSDRIPLLIFVSDGEPDDQGRPYSIFEAVERLAKAGICVHTVGYGSAITPGSAAEEVLKGSASISDAVLGCGEYHYAPQDETLLQEIFTDIYNDIILRGSLEISSVISLPSDEDAVLIAAKISSAFNGAPVPGTSVMGCSAPAIVRAELRREGDLARIADFVYDKGRNDYIARVSDIDEGDYVISIEAQSALLNGTTCVFTGTQRTNLSLEKPLGFVGCESLTCGEIGDYLAYSIDFISEITVNITDTAFKPSSIRVSDGTTVVWVNVGKNEHSVASPLFSSGILSTGQSFSYTFEQAGNVDYIDNIASLRGTVDTTEREEYAFGLNESVDVILAVDTSGSMAGSKLEEAIYASQRLVRILYRNDRAAIIQFEDEARITHPFSSNKESLMNSVSKFVARGGTKYIPPLTAAEEHFQSYSSGSMRKMIIFLSDGQPWDSTKDDILIKVRELVDKGICVYTVGYGDEVGAGSEAERILKRMADISKEDKRCGEYYYSVRSAAKLSDIFGEIYKEVLTLESIDVNISMPSRLMSENGTMRMSVRLRSRYNDNPIPGFGDRGACIPPARVQVTVRDSRGLLSQSFPLDYGNGEYTATLKDLAPGIYTVDVQAEASTSGAKTCNFYGEASSSLLVTVSEDRPGISIPIFNVIIVLLVIASLVYAAWYRRKHSPPQQL